MRPLTIMLLTACLLSASAGPSMAQSPSSSPEPAGQRVEVPVYGVSIIVPDHWTTDLDSMTSSPLYPESELHEDLMVRATGAPDFQQCLLVASSPLGCSEPVDLSAELAAPGWEAVQLPAGEAAHREFVIPDDIPCSQYLLTDGLDVYSLQCCGTDRAADDWRSIADTFAFPQESRWSSPAAADRDLLDEVWIVLRKPSIRPPGWASGEGTSRSARQHLESGGDDAASTQAMVEVLGIPPEQVTIPDHHYESEDGEVLLAVDGIWAPGATTETVLEALLAWLADDWDRRYEAAPSFDEMDIGGRDVLAVTFGADGATEYIHASGDSAIRVRGSARESVITMLEALSCRYVDVRSVLSDYRSEQSK